MLCPLECAPRGRRVSAECDGSRELEPDVGFDGVFLLVFAAQAWFVEVDLVDVPGNLVAGVAAVVIAVGGSTERQVGVGDAVHAAVGLDVVGCGAPVDLGEVAARVGAEQFEVLG